MKKILLIQSRKSEKMLGIERGEYVQSVEGRAEIVCISSLDEGLSWTLPEKILAGYNAVILGGSGDFDFDGGRAHDDEVRLISQEIVTRLRPLVEYILKNDFPTLGICYGHQIIAEALGVKVMHDKAQTKVGSFPVTRTEEGSRDILFTDMPDTFMAQYGHKDSLSRLPAGAVLLAKSDQCFASVLRYGQCVYTTQFHPESTAEGMVSKLSNSPGYLPEGITAESIVKPSLEASKIIPNFIDRILIEVESR